MSSANESGIEVMALLEAYRLLVDSRKENNPDHCIRVCQAIVAGVFGYNSRNEWTDAIQTAGLVSYNHDVDLHEQYKALNEKVKEKNNANNDRT